MRNADLSAEAETAAQMPLLSYLWVVLPSSSGKPGQHAHAGRNSLLQEQHTWPHAVIMPCQNLWVTLDRTHQSKYPPPPRIKARFHQTGWARLALPHLTLWHTLRCPSLSWHQLWGGVKKQGRRTNVWHYTLLMVAHNYAHVMILLCLIKNWSDWCQKSDSGSVQSLVVNCIFFLAWLMRIGSRSLLIHQ